MKKINYSLFTKVWKKESIDELIALTKRVGCDGIEFPLRDGYQIEAIDAEKKLPELSRRFEEQGLKILSVASEPIESVFAGCAASGVPFIRIMYFDDVNIPFFDALSTIRRNIDSFLPLCEKYNVKVGIQQHTLTRVSNSMELFYLVKDYDPKFIGGIWDAGHSGLCCEEPEQALDILWSHLVSLNFKNIFYKRKNGPESVAEYMFYCTTGDQGLNSWKRTVNHLKKKGYSGNACIFAEYTDEENAEIYATKDKIYLKELFDSYM